ncbi:MAG: ABC transporter permease, partial [Clostridia bacterium]|nr:ABC transporter permease [Clostridia bacterium]
MKKKSLMRSIAAAPHIFWAILFIVLPLIIVVFYAFTDGEGNFSFENIASLSDYVPIFSLSIELAIIATAISLIIGYPLAYIIAKAKPK